MPDRFDLTPWQYLLTGGGFAAICGGLSYVAKVVKGEPFRWLKFALSVATSFCMGLICFEILAFEGVSNDLAGACCGVAGFSGGHIVYIFEAAILKKMGMTKAEAEEILESRQDREGESVDDDEKTDTNLH